MGKYDFSNTRLGKYNFSNVRLFEYKGKIQFDTLEEVSNYILRYPEPETELNIYKGDKKLKVYISKIDSDKCRLINYISNAVKNSLKRSKKSNIDYKIRYRAIFNYIKSNFDENGYVDMDTGVQIRRYTNEYEVYFEYAGNLYEDVEELRDTSEYHRNFIKVSVYNSGNRMFMDELKNYKDLLEEE